MNYRQYWIGKARGNKFILTWIKTNSLLLIYWKFFHRTNCNGGTLTSLYPKVALSRDRIHLFPLHSFLHDLTPSLRWKCFWLFCLLLIAVWLTIVPFFWVLTSDGHCSLGLLTLTFICRSRQVIIFAVPFYTGNFPLFVDLHFIITGSYVAVTLLWLNFADAETQNIFFQNLGLIFHYCIERPKGQKMSASLIHWLLTLLSNLMLHTILVRVCL